MSRLAPVAEVETDPEGATGRRELLISSQIVAVGALTQRQYLAVRPDHMSSYRPPFKVGGRQRTLGIGRGE